MSSDRGDVVALDGATGAERWRSGVEFEGTVYSRADLAAADGLLYLNAADGPDYGDSGPPMAVVALDAATGAERWRFSYDDDLWKVTLTPAEGTLYLTAGADESDLVIALDGRTGVERWRTSVGQDDTGVEGPPAVVDGVVYISLVNYGSSRRGFVVGFDAVTGAEVARAEFEGLPVGGPAVVGVTAYVKTFTHDRVSRLTVFALDMTTGTERWHAEFDGETEQSPLVVADGFVYVNRLVRGATEVSILHALDATNGQERWTVEGAGARVFAAGVVYGGANDKLIALDAATGQEQWRLPVSALNIAVADGRLYVAGRDDHVAIAEWSGPGTPVPVVIEATSESPDGGEPVGPPAYVPPDIAVVNAGGSNLTTLARGNSPVWSPDGTKIAYESGSLDEADIWVMNADGSGQTPVAPVPGGDSLPSWSPDGTKIAFLNDQSDLYVVGADGSGLRKLTSIQDRMRVLDLSDPAMQRPSWSADSSKIAYASNEAEGTEIWAVNADGTGKTRLTNAPSLGLGSGGDPFEFTVTNFFCPGARPVDQDSAGFLPNADPATYDAQGCRRAGAGEVRVVLYSAPIGSKEMRTVARGVTDANGTIVLRGSLIPSIEEYGLQQTAGGWGGGGNLIVPFASSYVLVNYASGAPNADSDEEVVTDDESVLEEEIPDQPSEDEMGLEDPEMTATGPAWSPDGSKIACVVLVPDDEGEIGAGGIWVMNADGTDQRQITDVIPMDTAPAWSSDSRRLVFSSWYDETDELNMTDLYTVNVDGSGLTKLTQNDSLDYGPVWSPDGTKIAFGSLAGQEFGIFTIEADGSGLVLLVDLPGQDTSPSWSPDGTKIAFVAGQPETGGGD